MPLNPVSFTSPYSAEEADIQRRQALAQALGQRALQPMGNTEMAGPIAIRRSPWEGAAKMMQGYVSGKSSQSAIDKEKQLQDQYQNDYRQMIAKGLGELQGTPAQTLQPSLMGGNQEGETGIANVPSQAPNPTAALATFGSHPMGAPLMPLAMQQIQRENLIKALGGQGSPQGGSMPQGMPPQASGGAIGASGGVGGPAGGVPMEAWLQADPTGKTYMEALAKQNAPINVREGGAVYVPGAKAPVFQNFKTQPGQMINYGSNGPTMGTVPGAIPSMAAVTASQAGAAEAGKAPYNLTTLNTEGAPTMMTQQQAIEQATGRPMPQPGMQQVPQETMGTTPPPRPGTPEYQAYQAVKSGSVPTAYVPQAPQRSPGLRLQDQGAGAFQREYGGELAKSASKIVEGGDMGRRLNDLASAMDNARQQMIAAGGDVNKLAGVQQSVTQLAQAFGVDPSKLGLPKDAGPMQLMDSITNRMAMGMIGPGGMPANNFSEADREFLINTMSKKTDTPQGFAQKLDLLRRVAARNIDAEQSWLSAEQQGMSHSKWRQQWNQHVKDTPLYPRTTTLPKEGAKFNEGQTATGPNGQKIIFRGGQWVSYGG